MTRTGMAHDLAEYLPEMTWRDKLGTYLRFYCRATSWAVGPLVSRWQLWRYGPCPAFVKDHVAHHFGFVDGIPPCTDGPICAEHGWELSPLVEGQERTEWRVSTVEATEACPVYKKVRQENEGATPLFMVVVDEGWRESILCEGMYEWAAGWLCLMLQGVPFAPGHRGVDWREAGGEAGR